MPTEVEARNSKLETPAPTDLKQIAVDVVERAIKAGATAAEAVVREGNEFSTVVRLGEVETLKESGAKAEKSKAGELLTPAKGVEDKGLLSAVFGFKVQLLVP